MASPTEDTQDSQLTGINKYIRNEYLEYWFAFPTLFILLSLVIFPMIWSLWISFTNLNLSIASANGAFVGIENYVSLLESDRFWNSMINTTYYVGVGVTVEFVLGFAIALFMANYVRGRLSTILFTLLLLPMMMAPIVSGLIWRLLLQESFGPINYILQFFGAGQPAWLSSASMSLNSVLIADIWQWTPFMILILYTGRLSVRKDLYEAAKTDGADRWFIFRHITVPQMKGVIAIALLLRAMDAFKFFDKMFVMTGGGPGTSSELATFYNYLVGFNSFSMGEATAMSWLLLIFAVILANVFLYVLEQGEGGDRVV